jgi:cobalt/nickel transport system permease protein
MHVPDGVIPLWLQLLMLVLSGAVLMLCARKVNKQFDDRLVPYVGVLAAVIFAAQFVNFPIPPSSGHLVGSTLLAVLVGPWAAIMIIALVLFVQALMGDGGILTYGLNLFNMGVFSCLTGWLLAFVIFRIARTHFDERKSIVAAAAVASYATVVLSATVLGLELLAVTGFGYAAFAAIVGIHALIGVGEAIITFAILFYFAKAHPQMISMLSIGQLSRRAEPIAVPQRGLQP